jgi:uncharacterized protein (DUF2384 family)
MAMAFKKPSHGTKSSESHRQRSGDLVVVKKSAKLRGGSLVIKRSFRSGTLLDSKGVVAIDRVVKSFGLSKAQLANTAGLSLETLYRSNRATASKTQARLKEMLEIVDRVADWAGGKDQAMAWYRAQPIPAFGGRTAESLVKDGKAADVRNYLDHVALGGFA